MKLLKIIWGIRGVLYKTRFRYIGNYSYIGKPLFITGHKQITIGKYVRIYPGCRIEIVNDNSYLVIGDNSSIGQNFHIVSYNDTLVIGKNTTISANVFITNVDHSYDEIDKHILEQPLQAKKTEIGDNCFIGYGSVIQAGTILGKQCIIGANSVVRGTYPDYCVIAGNPAKIIKQYENGIWRRT